MRIFSACFMYQDYPGASLVFPSPSPLIIFQIFHPNVAKHG